MNMLHLNRCSLSGKDIFMKVFIAKTSCFMVLNVIICFVLAQAMISPHPVQLYEKGQQFINNYTGDIGELVYAQDVYMELIDKYPNSPFGYLGMSQIYRIDAYLGDENYDMEVIRERAIPFALKALKLGPSIRAVHENYAFFEQFFDQKKN